MDASRCQPRDQYPQSEHGAACWITSYEPACYPDDPWSCSEDAGLNQDYLAHHYSIYHHDLAHYHVLAYAATASFTG
jgi:hypothetical protein